MKNKQVEIVYEDKDILVCIKPAGMATQNRRIDVPDVESVLRNHVDAQNARPFSVHAQTRGTKPTARQKPPYLAVIHRLDQPVQGLLVFAKTPSAARDLNKQLATRAFGKYYYTILENVPSRLEGTLENHLRRDAKSNLSSVCPADAPGAQFARLHYQVLHEKGGRCLAEITLDTGRHHQIRAQMSAMGCPVVGDVKYGARPCRPGHIELYASRLEFRHPATGKPLCFELPGKPSM